MGGACSTCERCEMCTKFLSENLKGKGHAKCLRVDEGIILE